MPKKKLRPRISTVSFTARPGRVRTPEEFQADLVEHLLADQSSFDAMWGRLQTRFEALMAVVGRKPPFIIEVEVQHVKKPEYRMFPAEKPDSPDQVSTPGDALRSVPATGFTRPLRQE